MADADSLLLEGVLRAVVRHVHDDIGGGNLGLVAPCSPRLLDLFVVQTSSLDRARCLFNCATILSRCAALLVVKDAHIIVRW